MPGTTTGGERLLATEEEGPDPHTAALKAMELNDAHLSKAVSGTLIFVYSGDFDDPSTLSERNFGVLLDFMPGSRMLRFITVRWQQASQPRTRPGGVRGMVTDHMSGLYVPEGARPQEPGIGRFIPGEIDVVGLDEGYIVLDGEAYVAFLEAKAKQPPGNDGYSR